ncbi:unnamed protein product [Dicrocoelium dendriticum]|nr:unnamed protein product [Dicrocoelium dendriticum]
MRLSKCLKKDIIAKYYMQYDTDTCEEIQSVNRTSEDKDQRTYRLRPKEAINLVDIAWYMNEHSKFVHSLNGRGSTCEFNGYVQLDESGGSSEPTGHTSQSCFP